MELTQDLSFIITLILMPFLCRKQPFPIKIIYITCMTLLTPISSLSVHYDSLRENSFLYSSMSLYKGKYCYLVKLSNTFVSYLVCAHVVLRLSTLCAEYQHKMCGGLTQWLKVRGEGRLCKN